MVAIVNPGETIRGVLSYNENKVKEGQATCFAAVGFGCEPEDLSFRNKLARFNNLTARNRAKMNTLHISLSFHPSEKLNQLTLEKIAASYMEKIGFGDQPYLLYEHTDAGHPHIHIATVNIRQDGSRIDLHNIGKIQSSKARREVEKEFGLVRAEGRKQSDGFGLPPLDVEALEYGKGPLKAKISNIVRTVLKHYKYASFTEFNTILRRANVAADLGQPGTQQHEHEGILYRALRPNGEFVGKPIKASSIYDEPTMKKIRENYEKNRRKREVYKPALRLAIDRALQKGTDKDTFIKDLKAEKIDVIFWQNEGKQVYGITFIDHNTRCIFNGRDLGPSYAVKAVMDRMQLGSVTENEYNLQYVDQTLENTDFGKDFPDVLRDWAMQGMLVNASVGNEGIPRYWLGHFRTDPASYLPADQRITSYLRANNLQAIPAQMIRSQLIDYLSTMPDGRPPADIVGDLISNLLDYTWANSYLPHELLKDAKRKKKRRRRHY